MSRKRQYPVAVMTRLSEKQYEDLSKALPDLFSDSERVREAVADYLSRLSVVE